MSRALRYILLVVALLPWVVSAVEVENLYVARVDASLGVNEGLMHSFEQVVVRASGQRNALVNPLISQQRKHLKDYVGQYGYIEDEGQRWLEVSFNQEAMERLLRQANLPVWGRLRPLTLVWLVQEKNFQRELLSDSALILQQAKVSQIMQQRGVPMLLPLLDLEDITLVDQADVWGNFIEPVLSASNRYLADEVVLAKLYPLSDGDYQVSWRFYSLSTETEVVPTSWSEGSLSGSMPELVKQFWQQMSDTLGERFATRTANAKADHVQVAIYNLTDLERVLVAEQSLSSMAMVSHVELQKVDGNRSIFKVHLLAPAADFFQALQLDQQLEALTPAVPVEAPVTPSGEVEESQQEQAQAHSFLHVASIEPGTMNVEQQQLTLDIQLPDDETFASFWPGGQEAVLASLQHSLNAEQGGMLYLWGPQGAGKSHLLHAAMNWCAGCHQPSSYIPLHYSQNLTPDMLQGLEQMHLVCLDNLEQIAGQKAWEEAIFDLFNRIKEQGKLLVVTAEAPARHLKLQLADLRSRLDWGVSYQLKKPGDDEKLAILQLRANARGLVLSDEAGRFLLHRASRDMAELWQTLARLDTASMAAQRKLTIPFIKEVLGY